MARWALTAGAVCLIASDYSFGQAVQLPDAPGREVVRKICSGCHPAEIVLGKAMTRDQWGNTVSNMISRGARGSDSDFATIIDYLSTNFSEKSAVSKLTPQKKRGGGGLLSQAGAADKQVVDEEAAERGKKIYIAQCITCHGPRARGVGNGPDLVRSLVVLKDRYGDRIGPFLMKGHPMQGNIASSSLSPAQIQDLSHFLHQKVEDTLRTGPYNNVLNVLTGDAGAGKAYFNGPGKCSTCHSVTGDLAGIANKYRPAVLQQKMVFPQTIAFAHGRTSGAKKEVTVTVDPPSSAPVSGTLEHLDDFDVSLRTPDGEFKTFRRTPDLKVEKHNPYAAHEALLDRYTDKDIHDLVAYLETLK